MFKATIKFTSRLVLLLGTLCSCATVSHFDSFRLAAEHLLYDGGSVEFVPHTGTARYASYLAMNLPHTPVATLQRRLETEFETSLISRGEAHITVITPPEYVRLRPYVSMVTINRLAGPLLQTTSFRVLCLGRSQASLNGTRHSTYFLVVDSPGLLNIRRQIAAAYREAGGSAPAFTEDYHPHITIGFTKRDLYANDGAIKDRRSCLEKDDVPG